ncbi:MAG TPA: transcriptional repressor LexA [Planctomycetota bacterium]|nr:transcriptional repressor LexA [Planctomycetota bacterium]
MQKLTDLQARVLAFIQTHVRQSGRAPSYRKTAAHLGVDVRSAYQHIVALERKGVLGRAAGKIELHGGHRPPPGIPVLGRVAAGAPILALQNAEEHLDLAGQFKEEGLFLLRVKGDSMTGAGIHDGDLVLARRQESVEDGEIAVVVVGEEATVKRVRRLKDRIRLEPANPSHEPMTFKPNDGARVAGKVLMALRRIQG